MQFNCGPSILDRIANKANARRNRLQQWHKYFAWLPMNINGTCYWLEHIERKGDYEVMRRSSPWKWEYRAISH